MWCYIQDNTQHGPVEAAQIPRLIADGIITPQTMVWREGMSEWQAAEHTSLVGYFRPDEVEDIPVATVVPGQAAKLRTRKMNLWSLAGMGWMFGALLIGIGMQNSGRLQATSGKPNRMTLAELVKQGPGSNPYVELTNLRFGEKIWVEKDRNTDVWTSASAFLFTENDPINPVAAADIDGGGKEAMTKWMSETTLRGLAEERPRFFTSYHGKKLYEMYPKVKSRDLKWYIKVVTRRPSETGVKLAYGSGILLLVGGTICAFMVRRVLKA